VVLCAWCEGGCLGQRGTMCLAWRMPQAAWYYVLGVKEDASGSVVLCAWRGGGCLGQRGTMCLV
jgi:hypothetical protein